MLVVSVLRNQCSHFANQTSSVTVDGVTETVSKAPDWTTRNKIEAYMAKWATNKRAKVSTIIIFRDFLSLLKVAKMV